MYLVTLSVLSFLFQLSFEQSGFFSGECVCIKLNVFKCNLAKVIHLLYVYLYTCTHAHTRIPGKTFYNALNCGLKSQCAACVNGHQI